MDIATNGGRETPAALSLLASERPRNVNWFQSAALLFGDWGTSRLYVLGLAFLVAGRTSFWLIAGMSALILCVGWAYSEICRIYPDGGGVYTAAKEKSRLLGVIAALLLFADYTVTASLSSVDAFHYFGLGSHGAAVVAQEDPGDDIRLNVDEHEPSTPEALAAQKRDRELLHVNSPGLWAILSILAIGVFNLMGPKHTAGFALFAAAGMILITVLVVGFSLPRIDWANLDLGSLNHGPLDVWRAFVYVVLALSGVEAIANLTGVMKKPVYRTARRSIWLVAAEVAVFNLLLAVVMIALSPGRHAHTGDMLAFIARHNVGAWGEWAVRILGGLLLLSAANTAINGLMSIVYVMSRDAEMPAIFQKLNSFGAPWIAAILAAGAPAVVLLFAHDLQTLASLYAIGVVGAVAINCTLCAFHPRLRSWRIWGEKLRFPRSVPMLALGVLLIAIWITLAMTKVHALIFVCVVMIVGLSLRAATRAHAKRRPKPSLLRQAIVEQLPPDALALPRVMLATAGSDAMADAAIDLAKREHAALVVSFIRDVALNYRVNAENVFTLDTDPAAQALFADFLKHGHDAGVPIIPMYDTGSDAPVAIAEGAAMNGVSTILIGSSRRSALHQIIKGKFQNRLEALLPPEVTVRVLEHPHGKVTRATPVEV
jgi:amino acid transporter/nucleotide-binding universal stress UspA family protein